MLDLDKKVGNRVCSNTLGFEEIRFRKHDHRAKPYVFKLRTGCKSEVKRGKNFCEGCTEKFSVKDKKTGNLLFLESMHPLGNTTRVRDSRKGINQCEKDPGES